MRGIFPQFLGCPRNGKASGSASHSHWAKAWEGDALRLPSPETGHGQRAESSRGAMAGVVLPDPPEDSLIHKPACGNACRHKGVIFMQQRAVCAAVVLACAQTVTAAAQDTVAATVIAPVYFVELAVGVLPLVV